MNKQKLIQAYKDEQVLKVKERLFLIKQVLFGNQIALHVAKSLGHVRSWAYKWLDRFEESGVNGLHDMVGSMVKHLPRWPKLKLMVITNGRPSFRTLVCIIKKSGYGS